MFTGALIEEYHILMNYIIKGKKIIVFGTGEGARRVTESLQASVSYYIDNNSEKWGTSFIDAPVKPPTDLMNEERGTYIVLVGSMYYVEISEQLRQMGLLETEDFFNGIRMLSGFFGEKIEAVTYELEGVSVSRGIDPVGRVFIDKSKQKVYRGIYEKFKDVALEVYAACKKYQLFGQYVIPTTISEDISFDPFALIFEHEFIKVITYPQEWPPLMFRDATIHAIDLLYKLDQAGLYFQDPHPGNMVFDRGEFICIDFGAIRPKDEKVTLIYHYEEFIERFINPLVLLAKGQFQYVNTLTSHRIKITEPMLKGYLSESDTFIYQKHITATLENIKEGRVSEAIAHLKYLQQYFDISNNNVMKKYYNLGKYLDCSEEKPIGDFIVSKEISSVMFLGKDIKHIYSKLPSQVSLIVAADNDFQYLDSVYEGTKASSINLITMVLDFVTPTPPYALQKSSDVNYTLYKPISDDGCIPAILDSAKTRVHTDIVICMSLLEYLVCFRQISFIEFIRQLAAFTTKYAVIRFTDRSDEAFSLMIGDGFSWYRFDNFLDSLSQFFEVEQIEEIGFSSYLVFCRKKGNMYP